MVRSINGTGHTTIRSAAPPHATLLKDPTLRDHRRAGTGWPARPDPAFERQLGERRVLNHDGLVLIENRGQGSAEPARCRHAAGRIVRPVLHVEDLGPVLYQGSLQ